MGTTMVLKDGYPCLEPLVNLPEPTRKLLTAYETVSETNDELKQMSIGYQNTFMVILNFFFN